MARKKVAIRSVGLNRRMRYGDLADGVRELRESGLFTQKQAAQFAFDLGELLEVAQAFPDHVEGFSKRLRNHRKDATLLSDAIGQLAADMAEFRYHARGAARACDRLKRVVLRLPPFDTMDWEKYGQDAAAKVMADLEKIKRKFHKSTNGRR